MNLRKLRGGDACRGHSSLDLLVSCVCSLFLNLSFTLFTSCAASVEDCRSIHILHIRKFLGDKACKKSESCFSDVNSCTKLLCICNFLKHFFHNILLHLQCGIHFSVLLMEPLVFLVWTSGDIFSKVRMNP